MHVHSSQPFRRVWANVAGLVGVSWAEWGVRNTQSSLPDPPPKMLVALRLSVGLRLRGLSAS